MEAITAYIENTLKDGGTTDNRKIRSVCEQNGIDLDTNISKVKEAVEIGLMHLARSIAQSDKTLRQKYDELIDLYNRQPYVGTKKTLKQMVLQQYSTPLPIAFLMSEFVKGQSNSSLYFEPSAGNGFLTIALPQENTICNEIDRYRLENLKNEHYRKVSEQDARQPFEYNRIFDGVVTNPPFLKGQETNTMIFNALETMKDSGRCAILRDGNAQFTDYAGTKLRSSFTGFYDRLFQEYNVVKIININAKKIYAKQGTSFFMHIILINGRRAKKLSDNDSMHRVYNPDIDKIDLAGFEELWEYFSPYFTEIKDTKSVIERVDFLATVAKTKTPILLIQELRMLVEVGDEFIKPKKFQRPNAWLSENIKDKYDLFYVSHISPDGSSIFLYNEQSGINETYYHREFCKLGLQFYKHYKPKRLGSIDVTYIIEYGDDIKAFIDGRFVLSCDRNGYVNPYFTIKYSNEAERLHRFRNYCEHVFKHTFEVKGGDSYVSPLLIKELGLINNNTSKKLSKSDKIYLESIDVSKYDFAQIEDAISAANFYVYKIKDGEDILKLNLEIKDYKKVTFEKAVELVGREVVLSGLSRAAFHFTAGRTANGYDLYIKIPSSFFLSGLSGIDEDFADKLNEFILNDYKLNDRQEYFSCGYANNILQACGLDDDKEIIITQGDMKKILGHKKGKMDDAHDLTPIETLRIPQLIQKPILVIKGNTSDSRLIFIEIPRAGRKIFAVVYLDVDMVLKKRGHYNLVASVYSQEEEKIQNKITATAATNDIWYYDSKVIKNWLSSMGQLHLLPLLEANSMYSDKDF